MLQNLFELVNKVNCLGGVGARGQASDLGKNRPEPGGLARVLPVCKIQEFVLARIVTGVRGTEQRCRDGGDPGCCIFVYKRPVLAGKTHQPGPRLDG